MRNYLYFLPFVLFFACQADGDPEIAKISKENFSEKDAVVIGAELKKELVHFYEDEILDRVEHVKAYDYVDKIFKMVLHTPEVHNRVRFDWSISIIDNEESWEMYSIPGGHMFITTGLLKHLESESQLMMMIAHEISYSDRLVFLKYLKEEFGSTALGDILLHEPAAKRLQMVTYLRELTIGKEEVDAADAFAVSVVCPFRYNTDALKDILESDASSNFKWIIYRPSTSSRVANLIERSLLCGTNDRQFPERYRYFKNFILP